MNSDLQKQIQENVEGWFANYKVKRASNHLERVVIGETTSLISYKMFLGFKVSKKYDITPIEIAFNEKFTFSRSFFSRHYGMVSEKYEIECAIDESNKKVFWKGSLSERKLQYN